jgi:hypothetical protein
MLRLPFVDSVYIRRSVAAGEAEFPWSDLDLGVVIGACSGDELYALRCRFQRAKILFPRLGECVLAEAEELAEMAAMDPYRASLDRRFAIVVSGGRPPIPRLPIAKMAAARRLVFWFEHYLPLAVRQNNERNQRKFVKEMANALGVVEGRWPEPRRSRAETEPPPELPAGSPFAQCCFLAERAQRQLRPAPPRVDSVVSFPSLLLLPDASTAVPDNLAPRTIVATPGVLDLLLSTQNPSLWLRHGAALERLGFAAPPAEVWWEFCYRQASGERFRLPGFGEHGPIVQANRLAGTELMVERLAAGHRPGDPWEEPGLAPSVSLHHYYHSEYDELARRAKALRRRIERERHRTPPP